MLRTVLISIVPSLSVSKRVLHDDGEVFVLLFFCKGYAKQCSLTPTETNKNQ